MPYQSTKQYGHDVGLSVAFRQWKANSHCKYIHGYAIAVRMVFESDYVDNRNWVIDFGSFKPIKTWLEENFDHKLLVAEDDPQLEDILALSGLGVANVRMIENVGCEAFAGMIYNHVSGWLYTHSDMHVQKYVRLVSVEVKEHGANSALYIGA